MMVGMRATGTLSYNGFAWDAASKVTIDSNVVQDAAARTTSYVEATITAKGYVSGVASSDIDMQEIRNKLSVTGGRLIIANKGFGHAIDTGKSPDIKFGPHPKVIKWVPIGNNRTAYVEWQCTVCLPICPYGIGNNRVMEATYDVDYSNDGNATTRTISGQVRVANWRVPGTNRMATDVEIAREVIRADVPLGFRRTQSYHFDAAKTVMTFNVVDTEVVSHNPYPPEVTEIEGEHRVRWTRGSAKLANTLSVSMMMRADVSQAVGFWIALEILRRRTLSAERERRIYVQSVEITEQLYGRKVSVNFEWRVLGCITNMVSICDMFQPLNMNTWHDWRRGMHNADAAYGHPFGPRGNVNLRFYPTDDTIISICDTRPSTLTPPYTPELPTEKRGEPAKVTTPVADNSYLSARNAVTVESVKPVVIQSALQTPDYDGGSSTLLETSQVFPPAGSIKDNIQKSGAASFRAKMIGQTIRIGHMPPKPSLEGVGNATATEISFKQENAVLGRAVAVIDKEGTTHGEPIIGSKWEAEYALTESPGKVGTRGNPMVCVPPSKTKG